MNEIVVAIQFENSSLKLCNIHFCSSIKGNNTCSSLGEKYVCKRGQLVNDSAVVSRAEASASR